MAYILGITISALGREAKGKSSYTIESYNRRKIIFLNFKKMCIFPLLSHFMCMCSAIFRFNQKSEMQSVLVICVFSQREGSNQMTFVLRVLFCVSSVMLYILSKILTDVVARLCIASTYY